ILDPRRPQGPVPHRLVSPRAYGYWRGHGRPSDRVLHACGSERRIAAVDHFRSEEGHKALYLIVSFLPVPTGTGEGTVDRAIEFFMPVGQSGESQQWITSSMRLLSLAARGGFLERALSDMRKVAWDRGPVRLGTHRKDDGTLVPMWHDS